MAAATGYATSFPAISCPNQRKSPILSYSSAAISPSKSPKSNVSTSVPRWHVGFISQWSGLRHLGISVKQIYGKKGDFFSSGSLSFWLPFIGVLIFSRKKDALKKKKIFSGVLFSPFIWEKDKNFITIICLSWFLFFFFG